MNHWNEIAHNFLDANRMLVEIANLFPKIANYVKVLGHNVARLDLLNAENENAEEGVLDSDIVCALQTLLPDSQKLPLKRLLDLLEGHLGQAFILLRKSESPLLAFFFEFNVENSDFLFGVFEK